MIGNDVVDIELASLTSDWRRPGWLAKVFTTKEQSKIKQADQPDLLVWTLWSRKEAAYKAHQRRFNLKRKINPIAFECIEADKVIIGDHVYRIHSVFKNDHIYSTAISVDDTIQGNQIISKKIDDSVTYFIEKTLIGQGKKEVNKSLAIKKDENGIPFLFMSNVQTGFLFSITHHGSFKYIAYLENTLPMRRTETASNH